MKKSQIDPLKAAKETALKIQASLRTADRGLSLAETLLQEERSSIKVRGDLTHSRRVYINDSKNRYNASRLAFREKVFKETGVLLVLRGRYYPKGRRGTEKEPEMFLHLAAPSKEALDLATEMIEGVLKQQFVAPNERELRGLVQKIYVNIDGDRAFALRGKMIGPGGLYLKYIQETTTCKVQLRGKGSGMLEPSTGQEANEPLHIFVSGMSEAVVEQARKLATDLVATIRNEYQTLDVAHDPYQHYEPIDNSLPSQPAPPGTRSDIQQYYQMQQNYGPPGLEEEDPLKAFYASMGGNPPGM